MLIVPSGLATARERSGVFFERNHMPRALFPAYMLCLFISPVFGQFESTRSQPAWQQEEQAPHFIGDYACFWLDDTLTYTELYFQIPFQNLCFVRHAGGYQAQYEIELFITDASGSLAHSHSEHDKVRAATYEEAKSPASARAVLLAAYLRPGAYRLRAMVTDRETGKQAEAQSVLRVKDFSGKTLQLSDLQFSANIEANPASSDFVKNNRRVVPNVAHVYGQATPQLCVYYEIYNLAFAAPADSFHMTITIEYESGEQITRMMRRLRKPGASCVQALCLPIGDFPMPRATQVSAAWDVDNMRARFGATYRLTIEVVDPKTGQRAEGSGSFSILHQNLVFSDYSFEQLVDQLRCIASGKELERLRRAAASERETAIHAFWKSKDPTPTTPENELMEEYYRRVKFAECSFKTVSGHGWQSPQGQIYITFGPPDDVRRIENVFPDPPYVVWEYRKLNRRFIFAEDGKGNYKLLDPLSFNGVRIRR
jgi:GWxTD domain-containing protein